MRKKKFIRKWAPTFVVILMFIAWTFTFYKVGFYNGKTDTTKILTEKYETEFQEYVDSLNYVPEDVARTQAIDKLADYLDELIAGYSMNSNITTEGCYGIGWCFIARLMSKGPFGSTEEEILNKESQWQWYNSSNPVRTQDTNIAKAVATAYIDRHFPDDFTTDLCFAELKGDGSVVLRNSLYTDSNTKFWKYKMGS